MLECESSGALCVWHGLTVFGVHDLEEHAGTVAVATLLGWIVLEGTVDYISWLSCSRRVDWVL